jgi:hypothetical protein
MINADGRIQSTYTLNNMNGVPHLRVVVIDGIVKYATPLRMACDIGSYDSKSLIDEAESIEREGLNLP